MTEERYFVIISTNPFTRTGATYSLWSTTQGWVPWEGVWDTFTLDERNAMPLPEGGKWAEMGV